MTAYRSRRLAWSLFALVIVLVIAAVVLAALNGFPNAFAWGSRGNTFATLVPGFASALVGALIASRQPRNAVGWICLGIAVALAFNIAGVHYAYLGIETDPGGVRASRVVGAIVEWIWLAWVGPLLVHLVLLFPDGRPPSARWRVVAWLGAATFVAVGVSGMLGATSLERYPDVRNPLALEGSADLLGAVSELGLNFALPLLVVASAVSMVLRFRRAGGQEREQIKWFALAAGVLGVVTPIGGFTFFQATAGGAQAPLIAQDLMTVGFAAPLVATGIAILRYRLYDIDVVIRRTLVYAGLTAILLAGYLGGVLLLQLALGPVTEDNDLAIAGSTLAVAALFRPARRRVQELVDRRFYRRRYDAARTLEGFGARLRDEVDLDALGGELREVVAETMHPAHVSLWLRGTQR
ncbi:MAG: hypothetical protein ACR2NB_14640 [Solirubrobacteraceae bacterium]